MSPCRCGNRKGPAQLVCAACYHRLPPDLKRELNITYRQEPGSERHRAAVRACLHRLASFALAQPLPPQ